MPEFFNMNTDYSGTYLFLSENIQKLHIFFKIKDGYKVYKITNDLKKDKKHLETKEILTSDVNFKNEIDSIQKNFKKL